jgi:NitT/TauT family transport system ATP-binding protein
LIPPARDVAEVVPPAAAPAAGRPDFISIDGVSKTFRRGATEVRALDRVDAAIAPGEFVCLVGPSGCGKSTLMRIVAGLVPTTEGRVVIDGGTVDGPETRLGIVFQSPVLLDWRTVLGNVLLQVELRGLDPKRYAARARALLAAVGLDGFEESRPRELSGGMRQRCAIVRALIHDPPLLLMDEPFGALDALTREQMRVDLEDLWLQTRKTVVFITHSIDEAVLLADRVLVMSPRPGRIERVVDISLPRPRGLEARKAPGFVAAAEAITEIFLERGVLHAARGGLAARLGTPASREEPSGG